MPTPNLIWERAAVAAAQAHYRALGISLDWGDLTDAAKNFWRGMGAPWRNVRRAPADAPAPGPGQEAAPVAAAEAYYRVLGMDLVWGDLTDDAQVFWCGLTPPVRDARRADGGALAGSQAS